jgi:hypothetical protein
MRPDPRRDIKVYQNHAFIGAEAAGHGMQVFDLTGLREFCASPPPPQVARSCKLQVASGNSARSPLARTPPARAGGFR